MYRKYITAFAEGAKKKLYGNRFRTRDEAKAAIFEYIEIFYNRQRKHSSNNYKVPMDFMKAA